MAATKKSKSKAKRKVKSVRRKVAARRPAPRKKVASGRGAKKRIPVRRATPKAKRPAARRAAAKPVVVPAGPAVEAPPGQRIGIVTHYFGELFVAVVKLETGTLRVGDNIHVRGHTTDFGQRVESIQVNHAPVEEVGPNDDFGIKVREHAREHDLVYKVD
jgi:hypothetical protein